jgi:hypothetical protein
MPLHQFSLTFACVCLFSITLGGIVIPYLQDRSTKDVGKD